LHQSFEGKMKAIATVVFKSILPLVILFTSITAFSQQKYTISGYIKDELTGEDLIGASVYVKELFKGTATNAYGFFSLTVDEGDYTLVISYVGYRDRIDSVHLDKDIRLNVSIQSTSIVTEEVVITGEKADLNTDGTQMGTIELDIDKIKKLPAFMGEVDILKTIQFLPGVQSAGEGNTGFYVRGGGPDQNLILLDEATVYNASHLFGFFSVFNADAVKSINLIKGGMPANYGGRLASVLDISMKDGNNQSYEVDGGIGLIASRLTVQGPIKKDTSSFIVSARRTYIDILMKPFLNPESPFSGSGYFFYDLNAKLNYRISDKDRLFLSGYFGRDVFSFVDSDAGFNIKIPWGNATTSLRWNHLFSDKLFMNTTAIFSNYDFSFQATQSQFDFELFSGIRDWNAKVDFNYFPNIRHNIKFGLNYIYHTFTPSSVSASSGDVEFDTGDITKIFAHEGAVYLMDDFDLSDRFKMNIGLRYSFFQHVGPFTRFIKDQTNNSIVNRVEYGKGDKVQYYDGLEPRAAIRFKLNNKSSIKAGFTHNYQYVHLASISSVSLPTDVWFPSTDSVKPQIGTQYSIGYFRNFLDNRYEASVEAYYKTLDNLIEYKEGATPEENVNDNVDNNLTYGSGYSYGVEFFFKKRLGDLTGWLGYTWSKTERKFAGLPSTQGEYFPAKYDRRHDLSIVLTYELNERWTFGGVFIYATGNSITLPEERYFIENTVLTQYGNRNGFRMPAYHRADISATLNGKDYEEYIDPETGETKKKKKRFVSSWNFSVYNLYNRANPYFIYFDTEGDYTQGTLDVGAFQVSLFPILPSVTWNFNF
jgi:hypothetical protein